MKRTLGTVIALLAITTTIALAFEVFSYIRATPKGNDIVIQWQSEKEYDISMYEVERKSEEVTDFRRISRVMPKGSGSTYSIVDDGAFFKPESGKEFTYRVKAITMGGPEYYSNTATVNHDVSSVRRSWGMIKELFR